MIKSEIIANLSGTLTHLPEHVVAESVNHILALMSDTLIDGQRIEIRGFGSFTLHFRPPRSAHNPKTGERVITKPKYSPHFKPGKDLRDRINESRHHHLICEAE
jgi:integration host factor subunit beta